MGVSFTNLVDAPAARWQTISLPQAIGGSCSWHAAISIVLCLLPFNDAARSQPACITVVFELQQNKVIRPTSAEDASILKTRIACPVKETDRRLLKRESAKSEVISTKSAARPHDGRTPGGTEEESEAETATEITGVRNEHANKAQDASLALATVTPAPANEARLLPSPADQQNMQGVSAATANLSDSETSRPADFQPAQINMEAYDMFAAQEASNLPSVVLRVNPLLHLAMRSNQIEEPSVPRMPRVSFTGALRVRAVDVEYAFTKMTGSLDLTELPAGVANGEELLDADTLKLQAVDCTGRAKACQQKGNLIEAKYWLQRAALYRDLQVVATPASKNHNALTSALKEASAAHEAAGQAQASEAMNQMISRFNQANEASRAQCLTMPERR